MENLRQKRVAKQIQKDLAEIFQFNTNAWFSGTMITVTTVRITADLSLAKAYISILGKLKNEEALEAVNLKKTEIRYQLGKRIGNQVKKIPEIAFYIDDSYEKAKEIEALLNK